MKLQHHCLFGVLILFSVLVQAESQNDYKGIVDPFQDPVTAEFADDEKEDKEFFHLGRFLMIGFDVGAGIFTGGLGGGANVSPSIGGHFVYFFDRSIALELSARYAKHTEAILGDAGAFVDLDSSLMPILGGFRYYFDTRNLPQAFAVANPYLMIGGGVYLRDQTFVNGSAGAATSTGMSTHFGAVGGVGMEFNVYKRHLYFGLGARFHYIFFSDEDDTMGALNLTNGERSGDYFIPSANITYSF